MAGAVAWVVPAAAVVGAAVAAEGEVMPAAGVVGVEAAAAGVAEAPAAGAVPLRLGASYSAWYSDWLWLMAAVYGVYLHACGCCCLALTPRTYAVGRERWDEAVRAVLCG